MVLPWTGIGSPALVCFLGHQLVVPAGNDGAGDGDQIALEVDPAVLDDGHHLAAAQGVELQQDFDLRRIAFDGGKEERDLLRLEVRHLVYGDPRHLHLRHRLAGIAQRGGDEAPGVAHRLLADGSQLLVDHALPVTDLPDRDIHVVLEARLPHGAVVGGGGRGEHGIVALDVGIQAFAERDVTVALAVFAGSVLGLGKLRLLDAGGAGEGADWDGLAAETQADEPCAGRQLDRFRDFHTDSPSFFRKINKDITR